MFEWRKLFTLIINVQDWMPGTGDLGKKVLLNYMEDIASGLDFRGPCTAAALDSEPQLWFTFLYEQDFNLMVNEVEDMWNQGEWLSHDRSN